MKPKIYLYFTVLILALQSCATIAHGPFQKFVITSDPRVASIYIDGKDFGKTPGVLRLTRRKSHLLQVKLEGYETYEVRLTKKIDGWAFGNIAIGGLPGIAIDLITGSIYRLTPKDLYPTLVAKRMVTSDDVAVLITMTPNTRWEKIGSLP